MSTLLRTHPLDLRHTLNRLQPSHPAFNKLLNLWPQLRFVQFKVIHSADSAEAKAWKAAAAAVHQGAANRAERTSHRVASTNGFVGGVGSELIFAADVDEC